MNAYLIGGTGSCPSTESMSVQEIFSFLEKLNLTEPSRTAGGGPSINHA